MTWTDAKIKTLTKTVVSMFPDHNDHNRIIDSYDYDNIQNAIDAHNKKKNGKGFTGGMNQNGNCMPFFMWCLNNSKSSSNVASEAVQDSAYDRMTPHVKSQMQECIDRAPIEIIKRLEVYLSSNLHYYKKRWELTPELKKTLKKFSIAELIKNKAEIMKIINSHYDAMEKIARTEAMRLIMFQHLKTTGSTPNQFLSAYCGHIKEDDDYQF